MPDIEQPERARPPEREPGHGDGQPIPGRVQPAVVVLDWNGGAETLDCLASLERTTPPGTWRILVDNGSRESVAARAQAADPGLHVIRAGANLGYAGGNNLGIRWAMEQGATHVLILNNDARLEPGALAAMLEVAVADPRIAAVGAKILRRDDPSRLWFAWGEVSWRQSLVRLVGVGARDDGRFDVLRDVPWVSGCAILLSRRALELIGPFDEEFFAYHEEVDWCATAHEHGLSVVYVPRARVIHRGEASSGGHQYVSRRQYLTARNAILYARKHATPSRRLKHTLFLALTLPGQWLRRALTGEQEGVALKLRGIRDGLLHRPIPRQALALD